MNVPFAHLGHLFEQFQYTCCQVAPENDRYVEVFTGTNVDDLILQPIESFYI